MILILLSSQKVLEVDTREAQRLGMLRPLVRREIEKHMADFGLEPEFVSHNTMRGLSGGQKVKIVLGAATWRRPHVICLDEPTNYLDRESLAALIEALKSFEGGVLIITHNRDFSESICKEVWAMRDGHLEASGHNWVEGQGSGPRIDKGEDGDEITYDAMGNKIENKKQKKLTSAEARKVYILIMFPRRTAEIFILAEERAHGTQKEGRGRYRRRTLINNLRLLLSPICHSFLFLLVLMYSFYDQAIVCLRSHTLLQCDIFSGIQSGDFGVSCTIQGR